MTSREERAPDNWGMGADATGNIQTLTPEQARVRIAERNIDEAAPSGLVSFYTDLFTPETWKAFREHGAEVTGFRERQRQSAARISPGDVFCCYLVRLSRWCGLLQVVSGPYVDGREDNSTVRFFG
jgi:hypothetical protein